MEVIAQSKSIRISPRKIRLVADAIRRYAPYEALDVLAQANKRASHVLLKTLKSALANAKTNTKADVNK